MLQYYLGYPNLRDLSWTLALEVAFYVRASGALLIRMLHVPLMPILVFSGGAVLGKFIGLSDAVEVCSYLGVMSFGSLG